MNTSMKFIYGLATLGDFAFSLILTTSILYGIQLGGNPTQTGLIGGGYGLSYLIAPTIFGKVSDKISRRTSLLIATSLQFLNALFILVFVNSIGLLIFAQILFGLIYGFYWPSIEAFVSENTHSSVIQHRKGISNFCISWSIGYMLGPLIGGISSDLDVNIGFLINILIYLTAFLIVVFRIPKVSLGIDLEHKISINDNETLKNEELEKIDSINPKTLVKIILFTTFIYSMMGKLVLSYFTDYAVRPSPLGWSGTITGQIIFIFGIGRTIYFLLARYHKGGFFISSIKRIKEAFFVMSVLLIFIIFINSILLMAVLFTIMGFFAGLIYLSSLDLLIVEERAAKGAKAGLFESAIGLGSIVSPILAGFMGSFFSFLPFIVFSILIFLILLVINKVRI